jgi:hypothetical protein
VDFRRSFCGKFWNRIDGGVFGWECGELGPTEMPVLRYRCPASGLLAEVWTESDEPDEDHSEFFDTVYCQACGGVHLVNPKTGKVLGQDDE